MTRCIALLRGINISGKNKISMPELKAVGMPHSGHLTGNNMQRQIGGKRQQPLELEK